MSEDLPGKFYLGRELGPELEGEAPSADRPLLYDASDLTTHGLCVGMTGSGKTGLCLSLLEEAALDGIPALCIDPKGDLGNLLLTFPNLEASDFEPWVDAAEAEREGRTPAEHASQIAELWKNGLADWGQDGARIQRLRDRVDMSIYTPGSSAGLQLSVLQNLKAPSDGADDETTRERVLGLVSGLLALVGVEADPVQSQEHVFLSTVIHHAWEAGEDLAIGQFIGRLLDPPFAKIGVLDVESFFPEKARRSLAMKLNALIASPSFAGWLEGEPLDIQRLLYTDDGKPRITILSIAHLSDAERMFFVTLVLSELVAWMREQAGTTSLRALMYMDEVMGFLPPVAAPPSKKPLMTLLKQARAFGVGLLLATQNPVDVDYKALSNCGTWFLGRLQTERDVDRVMDGLKGAAQVAGGNFSAETVRATLAGLGSRTFLMNNVHDGAPKQFRTRWAMSYLRGPLTRQHIATLMDQKKAERAPDAAVGQTSIEALEDGAGADAADTLVDPVIPLGESASEPPAEQEPEAKSAPKPAVPDHLEEMFYAAPSDESTTWVPTLAAFTDLHYTRVHAGLDHWFHPIFVSTKLEASPGEFWGDAHKLTGLPEDKARPAGTFLELPASSLSKSRIRSIKSALKSRCYENEKIILGRADAYKLWSRVDEDRQEFEARVKEEAQKRAGEAEKKARATHDKKIEKIEVKLNRAKEKLAKERQQLAERKVDSNVSIGQSLLSAVFGRGTVAGHARRAGSAVKKRQRVAKEEADVARAEDAIEKLETELLEAQDAADDAALESRIDSLAEISEVEIRPKKTDIQITRLALLWVPESVLASA